MVLQRLCHEIPLSSMHFVGHELQSTGKVVPTLTCGCVHVGVSIFKSRADLASPCGLENHFQAKAMNLKNVSHNLLFFYHLPEVV